MTIFGLYISAAVFWLGLAVIFLIIEAATVGLTTIWFAAGSFLALALSLFNVPTIVQFIVFWQYRSACFSSPAEYCGKTENRFAGH
ncbi:MAG: NfeD family protein [Oscillospiraceae bacterium]